MYFVIRNYRVYKCFFRMAELKLFDVTAALSLALVKTGFPPRIALRLTRKSNKGSAMLLDLADMIKLLALPEDSCDCNYICSSIDTCVPHRCVGKRSHSERWSYITICGEATACANFTLSRYEFIRLRLLLAEIVRLVEIYSSLIEPTVRNDCDTLPLD